MAFNPDQVSDLLARCHRRCCICHRFCGVKMETDHITPQAEAGDDSIENAIPVCFECHAEIHSYNDQHPRGRKFRPEELRHHRDQWLEICDEHPDALVTAPRHIDVGPLQALIDELEFNRRVAESPASDALGCLFRDDQFKRAISSGSISILFDEIKASLVEAYFAMGGANNLVQAAWQHPKGSNPWAMGVNEASKRILEARPKITSALSSLQEFLKPESGATG